MDARNGNKMEMKELWYHRGDCSQVSVVVVICLLKAKNKNLFVKALAHCLSDSDPI